MEDGLRAIAAYKISAGYHCLNPCCYGRWSQSLYTRRHEAAIRSGLNPCCYGRWSQSYFDMLLSTQWKVLILVVMEDGLREHGDEVFQTLNGLLS